MSATFSSELYTLVSKVQKPSLQYHLVNQVAQIERMLGFPREVKIAFSFDPSSEAASDELKVACGVAKEAGADVFTYSTCHRDWPGNLTTRLGASRYVSKLSNIQESKNAG